MERELLLEMHEKIDAYDAQGLLRERYVVIFGSNESAEKMMDYLGEKGIQVNALVDNNIKKDGTKLNGILVTLPDKLLSPKKDNAVILIASRYYPEMVVQLGGMGYQEGTEILKAVEYSAFNTTSLTEKEFMARCQTVKIGEMVYKNICNKFQDIQKVFIAPLGELGATYVGMAFMRQYIQKHQIQSFALVTMNKACAKIAYLFCFEKQVFTVDKGEMEALLQYAVFMDMEDGRILIMNHRYPYTCRVGEIGNFKGIHFIDHYRYSIFQLEENVKAEIPYIHRDDKVSQDYTECLFRENELQKGNTVILFPYANTASQLSLQFWERLAEKLLQEGYIVCTNSSGKHEAGIKGTKELFFDLRYGLEVVEAAGFMIGLRSGICDVLSTVKAKKIILYPDRYYGSDSFMKFYSLNNIGLCEDAIELLWNDDIDNMLQEVLIPFGKR